MNREEDEMTDHVTKIDDADRAAELLTAMAGQPVSQGVAPIGMDEETRETFAAAQNVIGHALEARRLCEEARNAHAAMQYAAAAARQRAHLARSSGALLFKGTPILDAMLRHLKATEASIEHLPMPQAEGTAEAGATIRRALDLAMKREG